MTAKPVKLTATTPVGVFTRKTPRPYTHVITALGEPESWIRTNHAQRMRSAKQSLDYYEGIVSSGQTPLHTNHSLEDYARMAETQRAMLADADGILERRLQANREDIQAKRGTCLGWASSYALAVKAANSSTNKTFWANIEIHPVDPR